MTRFHELKRIERALEHKSDVELAWSLSYCEMRVKFALRKDHRKYWLNIQRKVQKSIESKRAD